MIHEKEPLGCRMEPSVAISNEFDLISVSKGEMLGGMNRSPI